VEHRREAVRAGAQIEHAPPRLVVRAADHAEQELECGVVAGAAQRA
jgi:hypothetical protein